MRWRTSADIPTPVSATWQHTRWPSVLVRKVRVPPSGMASAALSPRVARTWRSSAASPATSGSGAVSACTSPEMFRGASPSFQRVRTAAAISDTSWLRSTGSKARAGRRRLKSWSRRTVEAPSSTTCSIMRSDRRIRGSWALVRRIWDRARRPDSVSLKSCASSPAISRNALTRSRSTIRRWAVTSSSRRARTSWRAASRASASCESIAPGSPVMRGSAGSAVRRPRIEGTRAGRPLDLVGDFVDQVLHFAEELGGGLARLGALHPQAVVFRADHDDLLADLVTLSLRGAGEHAHAVHLGAQHDHFLAELVAMALGRAGEHADAVDLGAELG